MAIENAMQVCARAFFNQLTLGGYKVEFHTQLNNKKIRAIIDEVLASWMTELPLQDTYK